MKSIIGTIIVAILVVGIIVVLGVLGFIDIERAILWGVVGGISALISGLVQKRQQKQQEEANSGIEAVNVFENTKDNSQVGK